MLCRTANELFWMSRHIERAENTARMLDVTYRMSLLKQATAEPHHEWRAMLSISGLHEDFEARYPEHKPAPVSGIETQEIYSLLGAAEGQAIYHLVEGFHGLSTTVEANAQAAKKEFNRPVKSFPVPVTTLRALCREHAPKQIDFLKIDVEGAEQVVLEGNDWGRFRPKVIVAEAIAPITMAPSWDNWEPILIANGYRFTFADELNRYYADEDQPGVAEALAAKPPSFTRIPQIGAFKPALNDATHPDHRLALLFRDADMIRLPLLGAATHVKLLTAGLAADELDRRAIRRSRCSCRASSRIRCRKSPPVRFPACCTSTRAGRCWTAIPCSTR